MGGKTGYSGRSLGNTKELEKKAKEELRRGERSNTFLSFDSDDLDNVNLLRAHAKNPKSKIEFIDRSVREPYNSDKAEYIKIKITERIKSTSQTIVYLSEKTHKSKWVNWEIQKSLELGKKVTATFAGDVAPKNIPKIISDNKIKVIPWKELEKHL